MNTPNLILRTECQKALKCLYIEAPEDVSKDVEEKVLAYVNHLEDALSGLQLDAWRSGMTCAADIVDDARSGEEHDLRCIRDRIKFKRDETAAPFAERN